MRVKEVPAELSADGVGGPKAGSPLPLLTLVVELGWLALGLCLLPRLDPNGEQLFWGG